MHLSLPLHFMEEMYQVMSAPKPKENVMLGILNL